MFYWAEVPLVLFITNYLILFIIHSCKHSFRSNQAFPNSIFTANSPIIKIRLRYLYDSVVTEFFKQASRSFYFYLVSQFLLPILRSLPVSNPAGISLNIACQLCFECFILNFLLFLLWCHLLMEAGSMIAIFTAALKRWRDVHINQSLRFLRHRYLLCDISIYYQSQYNVSLSPWVILPRYSNFLSLITFVISFFFNSLAYGK